MSTTINYDHCLRPASTKLIINRLQKGDSINIFGNPGIGKTRLMEDIEKTGLENSCVILVSLKGYQKSYKAFCDIVCLSANLKGKTSSTLNVIIKKLQKTKERIFLLIDDFQYISNNPNLDPKYNQEFIDSLNSIKNISGVSLLIASHEPLSKIILFINKEPMTSVLNPQVIPIDPLMHNEIMGEINRRFKNLNENEKNILCSHLNKYENSYELLAHYDLKITSKGDIVLDSKILDKWLRNFKKINKSCLMRQVIRLTTFIKLWMCIINPFCALFNQLEKITRKPLSFIVSCFKKLPFLKDVE